MAIGDEIIRDEDLVSGLPQQGALGTEENLVRDQDLVVGLPPNNPSTSSAVDAATLGSFSPDGQSIPDTDVSFIQNQIDPLNGQPLALGDATQEMFTPGINQPLRVGGTSGRLTGSRDKKGCATTSSDKEI